MKKLYSMLLTIILIFAVILTGCKSNKEEKKSEGEKPPSSLEELQKLTDEVLEAAMKKDWSGSLGKTKEVQTKWNELYPELQKKGVSKDDVDNFVKDLNTLSDSLITKTMTIPKTEEKTKSEDSKSEDSQSEGSNSQESGDSQESKPGEVSQDKSKSGESKQASTEPQISLEDKSSQEKNKDPQKTLEEVDPLLEINGEELVIVSNSVELLKHIPKFTGLFGGKIPSDVLKLKYLLYHVNISAKKEDWEAANKTMTSIEEVWKSIEPKVAEVEESLKPQIAQSIKELKEVIEEKNKALSGMKSNVSIDNVEKLVKAIKDK